MKFGAFAPQGWKMELVAIDGAAAKWARTREVTLLAEELGYESIWVYDHFHNVPRPAHEAVFECWTTLAALAEATDRIRLGQMVSCTSYRPPALSAKIIASLDVISGGRVDWGVGAGWYSQEYEAYGYEFPSAAVRIRMLREAVELITTMWTQDDATYEGRHFRIAGAQCDPKPLQDPYPPVWIGGGGEQLTLRVVARLANKSNFGGNPDEFRHKREVLQQHCREVGRDEDEIEKTWSPELLIRDTEDEIRALHESGTLSSMAAARGESYDSWVAGNLIGTPEQIAERLRTYEALGCSYVVPWCADYPSDESLRALATTVMPDFR